MRPSPADQRVLHIDLYDRGCVEVMDNDGLVARLRWVRRGPDQALVMHIAMDHRQLQPYTEQLLVETLATWARVHRVALLVGDADVRSALERWPNAKELLAA